MGGFGCRQAWFCCGTLQSVLPVVKACITSPAWGGTVFLGAAAAAVAAGLAAIAAGGVHGALVIEQVIPALKKWSYKLVLVHLSAYAASILAARIADAQ